MRIRVVNFPGEKWTAAWWANERASGAVRGIHPDLDRMLDDPRGCPEVEVGEGDGIDFYQAMQRVPGYPVDYPDRPIPFAFDTDD